MIKVLLADDHQIIKDGIRSLLKDVDDITIVGETENGKQVIEELGKTAEIDVVLLDINMPEMNGIEAAAYIKSKFPKVKILALTMHEEEEYISKILQSGALGYILKKTGKEELIAAIRTVNEGKSYVSKEVGNILFEKIIKGNPGTDSQNSESPILTLREKEILNLIANEFTNPEIAEKLFISARTVDAHRRNLLEKLGVKNTAGLVKYAIQNGIA